MNERHREQLDGFWAPASTAAVDAAADVCERCGQNCDECDELGCQPLVLVGDVMWWNDPDGGGESCSQEVVIISTDRPDMAVVSPKVGFGGETFEVLYAELGAIIKL